MHRFQICRDDPDQGASPRMQTYALEIDHGDRMRLDVLIKPKGADPSLSFLRSCREHPRRSACSHRTRAMSSRLRPLSAR